MSLLAPEIAQAALSRALARGGDWAELYAEERTGFAVSLDDRRVERPQSGREVGASIRVVSGEATYFGHVDGLAEPDLLALADSVSQALRQEARNAAMPQRRSIRGRRTRWPSVPRTCLPSARSSSCACATRRRGRRARRSRR